MQFLTACFFIYFLRGGGLGLLLPGAGGCIGGDLCLGGGGRGGPQSGKWRHRRYGYIPSHTTTLTVGSGLTG